MREKRRAVISKTRLGTCSRSRYSSRIDPPTIILT
jgi:hypothetical protein